MAVGWLLFSEGSNTALSAEELSRPRSFHAQLSSDLYLHTIGVGANEHKSVRVVLAACVVLKAELREDEMEQMSESRVAARTRGR